MANKFNMPTEVITLPSKGLLYPQSSPLSSGEVEMKYMTAREEDILTNQNYIKQGVVIDKLLQSMVVTKFDFNELLQGDRDALMIAARILGYGKDYPVSIFSQQTGTTVETVVDLTTLKEKELAEELKQANRINSFTYTLPTSGTTITFQLLTQGLENTIDKELDALRKLKTAVIPEITTRLKYLITSVEGSNKKEDIKDFIDNYMLASDTRALRNHIAKLTPGMDLTFSFEHDGYVEEGVQLPIGLDFFWPDA